MKSLILLTLFTFMYATTLQAQGRKCIGASPCSACTTCTGCKYCHEQGGTCGVCRSSSSTSYKKSNNYSYKIEYTKNTTITVKATTVNLRSGPGTDYPIIIALDKYAKLEVIKTTSEDWVFVMDPVSGKYGYVYREYVGY